MYRAGIDLGGTNIKAGIVDENQKIAMQTSAPTGAERSAEEVIADMAGLVKQLMEELKIDESALAGIGVGCPGLVDAEAGIVRYSNNISWENVALVQELGKYFSCGIRISNDANCAALGEVKAGAAKDVSNAILLTLGTGVGGGIIINGKMVTGTTGAGGEIGHIHIEDNEPDACGCGNHGCLEQYASATGVVRLAERKLAASSQDSVLRAAKENGGISAKAVFDAVKEGDALACEVAEQFGDYLGKGLAAIAGVVNPEVFVLGGGVSKAGEILCEYVSKYYIKYVFHGSKDAQFKLATLGNDAGIYGAAKLVLE